MHAAIGQQDLGLADAAGIEDDLARRRIAGVVLEADAEVEVAERKPDRLAAPADMDHLALERHRAAERGAGLGGRSIFKTCVEREFAGADNELAHPIASLFPKLRSRLQPPRDQARLFLSLELRIKPPAGWNIRQSGAFEKTRRYLTSFSTARFRG